MTENNSDEKGNKIHEKYSLVSQLLYGRSKTPMWDYQHQVIPPISASTTFRLDSVERGAQGFLEFAHPQEEHLKKAPIYIYDRLGEPNNEILQENLTLAEGGKYAVTFATGMAAISGAIMSNVMSGHEVVSHKTLYGCTFSLLSNWLPRQGISVRFSDLRSTESLRANINAKTRVVYFETPVNPTLDLIDISEIRSVVDESNDGRPVVDRVKIVVDNTFATPYCQRPLRHGADIVVDSLTKAIGGFGTEMGGAVIGRDEKERDLLLLYRKDFGSVLSPKSAWSFIVYGLPTLFTRMRQYQATALKVANFLEAHEKIHKVRYPGLPGFKYSDIAHKQMVDAEGNFAPGSMIYFVVKGPDPQSQQEVGTKLINHLAENAYTITLAVSLGMTRSLVEHPSGMTHSMITPEEQVKMGIDPGGIRLSIGLESPEDIIHDLKAALEVV